MENKIIWIGQPKYKPRVAIIEIAGGGAEIGPIFALLPFVIILLILGIIINSLSGAYIQALLYAIALFGLILIPEIHKRIRRSNTKYILSDQDLTLELFWYGNKSSHIISFDDIGRIYLENYKDDCGIIHVYPKEELDFKTRSFWSGSIRHTITLEDVENAAETFELFQDLLKKSKGEAIVKY